MWLIRKESGVAVGPIQVLDVTHDYLVTLDCLSRTSIQGLSRLSHNRRPVPVVVVGIMVILHIIHSHIHIQWYTVLTIPQTFLPWADNLLHFLIMTFWWADSILLVSSNPCSSIFYGLMSLPESKQSYAARRCFLSMKLLAYSLGRKESQLQWILCTSERNT